MDEARRLSLLIAIARARNGIETIVKDPTLDFRAIARREKLAERHVRFLAPLAYLSPRIIEAITEGRGPSPGSHVAFR
jgi:site-specific DNA recombinase